MSTETSETTPGQAVEQAARKAAVKAAASAALEILETPGAEDYVKISQVKAVLEAALEG